MSHSSPANETPIFLCNSVSKWAWYLSAVSLKGGGVGSGVTRVSTILCVGGLTGLMIFWAAVVEDNPFCSVAIAEPAIETWPTQEEQRYHRIPQKRSLLFSHTEGKSQGTFRRMVGKINVLASSTHIPDGLIFDGLIRGWWTN